MRLTLRDSFFSVLSLCAIAALASTVVSCGREKNVEASTNPPSANAASGAGIVTVGVVKAGLADLSRSLTVSSELVPFQEIDVFAKESGYVSKLNVDYGTHVKKDEVMAVLEIPELQAQLKQDDAAIRNAQDMITQSQHEMNRIEAQHNVMHLQYTRLDNVAKEKPGLVAQQEVDDAEGKDLASEAQVEAAKSGLQSAQSQLALAQAKREHDQVLFDYSNITAPFAGVVTQRYANFGTLMQAGTSSSQAMPLVRLSQDDLFRLVIPVPETYVRYIRIGDPVEVSVSSLSRTFPGKVARLSDELKEDTRTLHTEVDVANPGRVLMPGMYADATLTLDSRQNTLAVPLQAVDHNGETATVMVVGQGDMVQVRPVTVGTETENLAEIDSGLSAGDRIVVSDRSGLKAGQKVRPQEIQLMQYKSQDTQQQNTQ